jgi:hypothetical protein
MSYILIPLLIVLMGMVVYSLVRGIKAFLDSTKEDLNRPAGEGASPNQLLQNKMMIRRIQYQALAIVVVGIIFAIAK